MHFREAFLPAAGRTCQSDRPEGGWGLHAHVAVGRGSPSSRVDVVLAVPVPFVDLTATPQQTGGIALALRRHADRHPARAAAATAL